MGLQTRIMIGLIVVVYAIIKLIEIFHSHLTLLFFVGIPAFVLWRFLVHRRDQDWYCRLRLIWTVPVAILVLHFIIPLAISWLFSSHPVQDHFGPYITDLSVVGLFFQMMSVYFGILAIVGILDELAGAVLRRPFDRSSARSFRRCIRGFEIPFRGIGGIFLAGGFISLGIAFRKGFTAPVFSQAFWVKYWGVLQSSITWPWPMPGLGSTHYLTVCGSAAILVGIWCVLIAVEPKMAGNRYIECRTLLYPVLWRKSL